MATSVKPQDYLLIFEFDGARGDRMSDELLDALRSANPGCTTRHWRGLLSGPTRGGTSLGRLFNLVWLTLRSCLGLLFGSKNRAVIVRSTPPLLHLPVALLCRGRGMRCVFWLMDYHPVIEQRLWARHRWLAPLLRFLDRWDRRELAGFSLVVVLDQAMADLVHVRNPAARVVIHPTWGTILSLPSPLVPSSQAPSPPCPASPSDLLATHYPLLATSTLGSRLPTPGSITFAYLGNFGQGHGWATLAACIRETARLRPVRLLSIGVPAAAEPAFAALAAETKAAWEKHPRMEFSQAVALLRERGASWGCVAMKAELAGCLSPSKFSGYLAAGVPLLYIGPVKTNAWQVCGEFGGGMALEESADVEAVARAAALLASDAAQAQASTGADRAREHFEAYTGETLAKLILSSS